MSVFSFFGRAIKWIGNILHKSKDLLEEFVPKAIEVVNKLKEFDTKNPEILDVLTAIIPGTWDDALKAKARASLPQILAQLQIIEDSVHLSNDQFIKAVLDKLNKLLPEVRGLYWHNIAILLTDALADGKLTVPEVTGIIQAIYEQVNEDRQP